MSEKKETVCVATRWFGARSEVWIWRQIRLFRRIRPHVVSWTHENKEDFPLDDISIDLVGTPEDPQEGPGRWLWRLRNLPSGNLYGTQGDEARRLCAYLQRVCPSVILTHFGQTGLRLLPVAQAEGIPLVVHFHGLDISSSLNNRYYRWSLQRSIRRFAAIVCVGSHQRTKLIDLGADPTRIHLIPCGVPTAEFVSSARPAVRAPTFVSVSRLVEWKGVHHTIGAFALLAQTQPEARLVIVGDGPQADELKKIATEHGITDRVRFTGSQTAAQVREHLQAADVFLQHSLNHSSGWFEGFGVSIAEASAMGLPVVVSQCGGITDQVINGETGFVVPQRDENAMAAAMARLAENPALRAQMGAAGRHRMISEFDTALLVSRLEQLLVNVARTS